MKDERRPICEVVAESIERLIIDGVLKVGQPLPSERRLCGKLGFSRSALREGLTVLRGRGIIDAVAGRRSAGDHYRVGYLSGAKLRLRSCPRSDAGADPDGVLSRAPVSCHNRPLRAAIRCVRYTVTYSGVLLHHDGQLTHGCKQSRAQDYFRYHYSLSLPGSTFSRSAQLAKRPC